MLHYLEAGNIYKRKVYSILQHHDKCGGELPCVDREGTFTNEVDLTSRCPLSYAIRQVASDSTVGPR